ncbi:MAG: serine/threonine protein kinase [Pyrinomonadaceae bacterium]|nr:serine/threonine protein kinase [Pyrinomonadaceae bacterium]
MRLLEEGKVIHGKYTVERFLGEGAFAEVYRVSHRLFGRLAMKVFKTPGSTEETEQALDEAIFLSKMGHRNIIRVFDADTMETSKGMRGFFTMEFIAGGSLQQFWQSHGDDFVPVEIAVDLTRQVCQGLALAHADDPPIVHRDIKPQNILVGYDAQGLRACVSDFGLAKRVNPLKLMASARGTRCFKAPETFRDPMTDSCAGDVWAVGLTLYLLLTDRFPYSGGDLDALDIKSFEKPMTPASRLNIQVDRELEQILQRSLAVKREERYQNALELLEDLNRWKPHKPEERAQIKEKLSSQMSKSTLGMPSPTDEKEAREMAAQAIKLSRQRIKLNEAADLMEEAFNKWPALREEYERQIKLWRCGIMIY